MTDRELAYNLGSHVINQMQRITALESFITEYCLSVPRLAGVSWQEEVQANQEEQDVVKTADAWRHGLRLAIDAEKQDSVLIRVLHNQFLKQNLNEE